MHRTPVLPGYEKEAEFYDFTWDHLGIDLEFYRRELEGRDRVLDCMCGTGRVAIALARAGHRVYGIDASRGMLRRARERARKERPGVRRRLHWRQGLLERTDLGKDYDAAIIAVNSYGLILSRRSRIAALKRIRHALRDQGSILLAIDSVRTYREVRDGIPFAASGGPIGRSGQFYVRVMAETGSRSERVRSTSLHLIVDREGGLRRSQLTQTVTAVLSPSQVRGELRQAGFRPTQLLGGYDGRPYSPSEPLFIVRATAE